MKPLVEVDTLTDLDLLRRSIDDPELFGTLFDRHGARVCAHLGASGFADRADALTVEVFTIAFRRRGEFRPDRETAVPWLLGIARNVSRNERRSDRRRVRLLQRGLPDDDRATHDDADGRVDASRTKAALHEALDALPREQREVLVLFALDELTYAEIAEVTGTAVGTVRSRLHRGRAAVRTRLATAGITLDLEGGIDG